MQWKDRIVVNPNILGGKPIVKGTRLAAEFLFELLDAQWSEADILQNYPQLTREDLQAVIDFRANRVNPLAI